MCVFELGRRWQFSFIVCLLIIILIHCVVVVGQLTEEICVASQLTIVLCVEPLQGDVGGDVWQHLGQ